LTDSRNSSFVRSRWYALLVALGIDDVSRLGSLFGSGGGARPIRFGIGGIVTFGIQMGFFAGLQTAGLAAVLANAIALAIAVQFNFAGNQFLVWADLPVKLLSRALAERWVTFHGCIALSLVINFGVFVVAQLFLPALVAVLIGIACSTAIKFVSLDRFAFRPSRTA
jgi:putative flippase GtrA